MKKPRIGLLTSAIDNRKARGTALVARRLLDDLHLFKDQFDFVLVHHETCDDPIYKQFPQVIIPRLPGPLNKQVLNELAFWIRGKHTFDLFHYLHPRVWPSYLFTRARRIVITGIEGGHMLKVNRAGNENWIFRLTSSFPFNLRMDAVIASSESGRTEIIEDWHIPPRKVPKIFLGTDERYAPVSDTSAAAEALRSRYGIPDKYILAVSRFDPHKNILGLLEAYAVFKERKEFPLVLIGGPHTPGYSDQVEQRIQQLRDEGCRVLVIPFVEDEDMPAAYSLAEMLVYPSLHEGFGLPVVEAMACGTPVIASNVSSIPEIAGEAAILIDPHDSAAIARAMEQVIGNEQLRNDLRARSLKQAAQFSWHATAEQTMALYQKLLA